MEVKYKRRKYRRKQSTVNRRFRQVCIFNLESEKYHTYLTNIPVEILSAEEIELIFKELKSHYRMDQIPSTNPEIVKCLI
jgi:IS4 transposase